MKSLPNYINEKLIVNKNYKPYTYAPKSFDELRKIIKDRYDKLGPGTKRNPIDFNDIDVSNIDYFCTNKGKGIFCVGLFDHTRFKYIDISDWDVSNAKSMHKMFYWSEKLESVGDISKWNVSSVTDMQNMFACFKKFNQDISGWDVSNVTNMAFMFYGCESFNQDISGWDVSNVTDAINMFENCPIKDEYKPKFK